jgi:hypothetical protein
MQEIYGGSGEMFEEMNREWHSTDRGLGLERVSGSRRREPRMTTGAAVPIPARSR